MTLYEILDVEINATIEEIHKAWKDKCKIHHPDRGGDSETMTNINLAHEILTDIVKREKYDKTGSTKSTPFEVEFQGMINQLLDSFIEALEPQYHNVVDELIARIEQMKLEAFKQRTGCYRKVGKIEEMLRRLQKKGNGKELEFIFSLQQNNLNMTIKSLEYNLDFYDKSLAVLNEYGYSIDQLPAQAVQFHTWS
jgi:curved DNA-binding protein CbpA